MLFNSLAFLVFLPLAFAGYWLLRDRLRGQNLFVLAASYLFYGWWDWRFLTLIAFSSLVDYGVGRAMGHDRTQRRRRLLLLVSVTVNLTLLGFFKYFNFFAESFSEVMSAFGLRSSWVTLRIVLPVGISFYTFQTMSYTIDVYRRKLEPTKDIIAFLAYVSFFPQLVAGPIERATSLLPQFLQTRGFDERRAVDGLRQILWGLFKKVVVADTCAILVDDVFAHYASLSSVSLLLAAFCFAMQIYGDFSGYSDIAIGTGRLFGFNLMRNFAYPYLSRDIAEFWRRWHISLSTWFRDYLYIPLGGSRVGKWLSLRNIVIVFAVSGFWHGANWTFVVWGLLNGLYFVPLFLRGSNRDNLDTIAAGRRVPSWRDLTAVAATFSLTLVAWIVFRSPSVGSALDYLKHMVTAPSLSPLRITSAGLAGSLVMLGWEWIQREREHGLEVSWLPPAARNAAYVVLIVSVIKFTGVQRAFIYFQF